MTTADILALPDSYAKRGMMAQLRAIAPKPARQTREPRTDGYASKTEAMYADVLERRRVIGEVLAWSYEPVTLILADRTTYTPDFGVWWPDGAMAFDETKGGFTREDGWIKLKIAASMFAPFRFRLCKYVKGVWKVTDLPGRKK